ncbi:MAG: magnesium transporter CorA family protein [bacterium]|nr:magnesium transporter CorA family protein [bacterium]
MLEVFRTNQKTGKLATLQSLSKNSWINLVNPTEAEIKKVAKVLNIDETIIRYSLDLDETARVEFDEEYRLIIVNVPIIKKRSRHSHVATIAFGMLIVRDDFIVTICLEKMSFLDNFRNGKESNFYTNKKSRFVIQLLSKVSICYLKTLNVINKDRESLEDSLYKSTKNKDLIKLLNVDKSLVYMETSLKSNEAVLEKLLRGRIIKIYQDDEELLEDTIIENKQAIETTHIYTEILSSTTEAFGTIISNNLNTVMKFLASITIVFSVPTMISSFMGMNVPLGMFSRSPFAFMIIIIISFILSLLIAYILKKKDLL